MGGNIRLGCRGSRQLFTLPRVSTHLGKGMLHVVPPTVVKHLPRLRPVQPIGGRAWLVRVSCSGVRSVWGWSCCAREGQGSAIASPWPDLSCSTLVAFIGDSSSQIARTSLPGFAPYAPY